MLFPVLPVPTVVKLSSVTNLEIKAAVEDFRKRPRPLLLRCGVQHYDWGGLDYVPKLLAIENKNRKPYAELWIGAHSDLPSVATIQGVDVPLQALVGGAADEILGENISGRFNRELPFLLKILSSAKPLSIQAHPNAQQAQAGFERENNLGVAEQDPQRSYHDPHHKPELICALTDFYALRGFRSLGEIHAVLDRVPEFQPLAAGYRPSRDSLIALYTRIMRMEQRDVNATLEPLVQRLQGENRDQAFSKQQPEYWVCRADSIFSSREHKDRGLFSVFLLNLVHLTPGEAMYLPAGELHAYLEGAGVEIMSNSNNVLRGGLTPKHVDVDELLQVLTFTSGEAEVIQPSVGPGAAGQTFYHTPAEEFVLSRLRVTADRCHRKGADHGVHLGILTEGQALISVVGGSGLDLARGDAFLIPQGMVYEISSKTEAEIFKASVPHV